MVCAWAKEVNDSSKVTNINVLKIEILSFIFNVLSCINNTIVHTALFIGQMLYGVNLLSAANISGLQFKTPYSLFSIAKSHLVRLDTSAKVQRLLQ